MAHKQTKGRNGVGESITLRFDKNDPLEAAALAMAQILASKHGRRKDAIIALLAAMYERYAETGELLTPTAITNALMGTTSLIPSFAGTAPTPPSAVPQRRKTTPNASAEPLITIVEGKSGKASAKDVGANLIRGAASFFD